MTLVSVFQHGDSDEVGAISARLRNSKRTRRRLQRFALALAASAVGCGDADDSGGVDETPTSLVASTVSGHVVDPESDPVADLAVSLCGDGICMIARTDHQGFFTFDDLAPGIKVIEATTVPRGDDLGVAVRSWTRFFDFVDVGDAQDITIEQPFVVHRVTSAVGPLAGSQDLPLTPTLAVTFDADAIADDGPLPTGADSVWIGAVKIPRADWPKAGLGDWTVLEVWGLAIWDLEAPDVFHVSAALPEPLAADAEVAFLVADYEYGFTEGRFFEEPAELSEDGAVLHTPANAGLDRATRWLAVTRSP